MTFINVTYWPKIQYWPVSFLIVTLLSWCYLCDVILYYCDNIVWQKHHSGATIVSDITIVQIWHHNSSSMPRLEHEMIMNIKKNLAVEVSIVQWSWIINIWHDEANIGLWCGAIWVLWIFCNNVDPGFTSVNSVTSDPYCLHHMSIFI